MRKSTEGLDFLVVFERVPHTLFFECLSVARGAKRSAYDYSFLGAICVAQPA